MASRLTATSRFVLPAVPPALAALPTTSVWLEFTPLAALTNPVSINLGQGFPDWAPPDFLTAAVPTVAAPPAIHQYARSAGHPALVNAIARHYSHALLPHHPVKTSNATALNPNTQVLVTVGASHALSLAIHALAGPGDEVVLIEPAFDIYTGAVLTAGASPVYVPMKPRQAGTPPKTSADLVVDMHQLEAAFSKRTKAFVLNSPHNPTGKVFSRAELNTIASIVEQHPHCVVISDEVYEHITYNSDLPHIPFASLSPSAFERTVSVYSAGKTFSATGWKVGWAIGPADIIKRMHGLFQYSVFSLASTLQEAISIGLDRAVEPYRGYDTYYKWLAGMYKKKRDYFVQVIRDTPGLAPVVPDGAFYVMARHGEVSSSLDEESSSTLESASLLPPGIESFVENGLLTIDPETIHRNDYNFSRRLALECQVVSIPPSAFFCKEHCNMDLAKNYARFAFSKEDSVLEESRKRLCSRQERR